MKKFTLILVFFLPFLTFAQEPFPQIRKKATTETTYGKNHIFQPLKKMEELQKEFSVNSFSEKIKQIQAEEEGLKNSFRENFPGREIIEKLRENMHKSAQTDFSLVDSIYGYKYLTPADSVLFVKIYMEYNKKGEIWSYRQCEWDSVSNVWLNTYREESYSDQNGNDTLLVDYKWDSKKNDWIPETKVIWQYDSYGRQILSAYYDWNNISQQWRGRAKFEYAFDEMGNTILQAYYNGWKEVSLSWIGNWKYESEYDEAGNQVFSAYYDWNYANSNWQGNYKTEYLYNPLKQLVITINYSWNLEKGDWEYNSMQEYFQDQFFTNAFYYWDSNFEKWIGIYKDEYFSHNDTTETRISYTWNIQDESWEADSKTEHVWKPDGTYQIFTNFMTKDSVIPTQLINGFNSDTTIYKIWVTPSCPDQTCTTLDSDFVEGDASILWSYSINGNYYTTGGFCQIDIENELDLSTSPGISFNYKVIIPSAARFIIRFKETSGETWEYESLQNLSDSSGNWEQFVIFMNEVYLASTYKDGFFDTENIEQIQIRLHVPNGKTTGILLIDNLTASNIKKSENWQPESMTEDFYDENGYFFASNSYRWNEISLEFVPYFKYKTEKVFNEQGNLLSNNIYDWYDYMDDWRWIESDENEYDENGYLVRNENYRWDDYNGEWVGFQKYENDFDEYGNQLLYIYYNWDYNKNDWIPSSKEETSYNLMGNMTSRSYYSYNGDLDSWQGNWMSEYVYNEQNEQYKLVDYEWDYELKDWKISYTYFYTQYESVFDEYGNPLAVAIISWDENLKYWAPSEKYYYFWSLHSITGIPEVFSHRGFVEVFPNPATDAIYIKLNTGNFSGTFSLFNSNGILLKKSNLTGDITPVQVNYLPKGNYILRIETDEYLESKKIIIQ